MKPTHIQFEYDDAKLEALRICLADKQTDVTAELETYMGTLYKKHVTATVRDFIEKKEELALKEGPKTPKRNVSPRRPVSDDKAEGEANTHESE